MNVWRVWRGLDCCIGAQKLVIPLLHPPPTTRSTTKEVADVPTRTCATPPTAPANRSFAVCKAPPSTCGCCSSSISSFCVVCFRLVSLWCVEEMSHPAVISWPLYSPRCLVRTRPIDRQLAGGKLSLRNGNVCQSRGKQRGELSRRWESFGGEEKGKECLVELIWRD